MMSSEQLEPIAEAIVFAHEAEVAVPSGLHEAAGLEHVAVLATAALAIADPVPAQLGARLAASGLAFCAERRRQDTRHGIRALPRTEAESPPTSSAGGWGKFLLGVAAMALLWFGLSVTEADPVRRPLSEQRSALLAEPGVVQLAWQSGPSPLSGAVAGDAVWSGERQEGYLCFQGLPPLDSEHRFQLWIVDGKRKGDPVDGGLFSIESASGETVVPITARLPIGKAAAFVVTVEEKAGAVVSRQEHVVAIASL